MSSNAKLEQAPIAEARGRKKNSRTLSSAAAVIHLLFRLSPEILRGFGRDGLNNPCRPCRPVASEEFFPFQESP
jgi:hypothetical protein